MSPRSTRGSWGLTDWPTSGFSNRWSSGPRPSAFGLDAYGTIHEKAGALFHSLVRNHPFVDGNKRTAVVAVFAFYALNGFRLSADDGDMVALALDTAQGLIDTPTIAKRLEIWVVPAELPDL